MKLLKPFRLIIILVSLFLPLLIACTPSGDGANPGLVDSPVVYAKRTIPVDNDGVPVQYDVREPLLFSAGGDLYIRITTSASVTERNITRSVTLGTGDVKDVSASYDGEKVVFSLRLADPDPNNPTETWNIYEYDVATDSLHRVIVMDSDADAGNDISPAYLPDGRIVFSSDRQKDAKAVLSDESAITGGIGKPSFSALDEDRRSKSLVLHVMDSNGDNIKQISFNQSHDLDPTVMQDGRILFSRWENAAANNAINLYTMNPDGSDVQMYYGEQAASHLDAHANVVQLTHPHVMDDGRVLVLARPFTDTYAGGDLLIIDGESYIDTNRPVFAGWNILTGPGQNDATTADVINASVADGNISRAGRYSSAFPLRDGSNRAIVSKGICQLTTDDVNDPDIIIENHPCVEPYLSNPNATERPPAYGLWINDLGDHTERPLFVAEAGYMLTDVVVLQPYDRPQIIADTVLTGDAIDWATEHVGVLDIRSVYDMGSGQFNCSFFTATCAQTSLSALSDPVVTADERPARFLRIIKAVGIPDPDDAGMPDLAGTAFGRNRTLGMREIIGYAPIEPDGSVRVKVPANVAFGIEVLDKYGRRLGRRHDNWLQVKPGETLQCNGCHNPGTTAPQLPYPHGRSNAVADTINSGMPSDGYEIPNTQISGTTEIPYAGNYRETLAEVKTRTLPYVNINGDVIPTLSPSVNILFYDYWTSPLLRAPDAAYSYTYAPVMAVGGLTTAMPLDATSPCHTAWAYNCRVVINYLDHIQPIWDAACVSCHNTAGGTAEPPGQLDLTSGTSDEEADHVESYQELFFDDNLQTVVGGLLTDVTVTIYTPVLDADGNQVVINGVPQFVITQEPVVNPAGPSMSTNGARASYFMEKLTNTELNATRTLSGTTDHSGFLTDAELRLIAEYLDLGGQYFNNPFDSRAPQN